jgi:hypothetical protein
VAVGAIRQRWSFVSMYSELLGRLCAGLDPVRLPPFRDELVVILLQSRGVGRRLTPGGRRDLTEDLALELDRDRMLMRLCATLGIETDTALFASPRPERERLEGLLGEAGVVFWVKADNRPVTPS